MYCSFRGRLPVILAGILVLPWQHKFGGNQSTFVLLHKACLEGYGNPTMMLSSQWVLSTLLTWYVNKELFLPAKKKKKKTLPSHVNAISDRCLWLLILSAATVSTSSDAAWLQDRGMFSPPSPTHYIRTQWFFTSAIKHLCELFPKNFKDSGGKLVMKEKKIV